MSKTIAIVGTFDSKSEEFLFLKDVFESKGFKTLTIHAGSFEPKFNPDINNDEVAQAANEELKSLLASGERGPAMAALSQGVTKLLPKLYAAGQFDAVISLGGSGGTSLVAPGMRALPIGVPKLIVSTMAAGNVSQYVGTSDLILFPSIVDVAGINEVSAKIFHNAAGAIMGMLDLEEIKVEHKPMIAATMFGLTTPAVNHAKELLEKEGYAVIVFHATGTGGKTMEKLISEGYFDAVLDLTTTEWCDELFGGVLAAGPKRSEAAAKIGIPQVVAPGAMDMVNFGPIDTIPQKYKGRKFYEHNPSVTLMRTTKEENTLLGEKLAEKLNLAKDKTVVLLPQKGFSGLDREGADFNDPEADAAFIASIKAGIDSDKIKLCEMPFHINDPEFSEKAVLELLAMLKKENIGGKR